MMIFRVRLEMLGQVGDALGEQRNLDLGRTRITFMLTELMDDFGLALGIQSHLSDTRRKGPILAAAAFLSGKSAEYVGPSRVRQARSIEDTLLTISGATNGKCQTRCTFAYLKGRNMRKRLSILACALTIFGACGSNNDNGTTDSGPSGSDSGMTEQPVATGDFSCVGSRTAPTPGEVVTFTGHVHDFQMGTASMVPSLNIQIFPDNIVAADCTGTCQDLTTDTTGNATAMAAAGSWFAYRAAANTAQVLTVGYNRVTPAAGGTDNLASVSSMTVGLIPTLFNRQRLPGTSIVAGSVVDCANMPVENAIVRFFQGDTELVPGSGRTDYFTGYFMGPAPAPSRTASSNDGRFAAANATPNAEPIRATIWARTEAGGELRMIACEEAQIFADGVTIITMGPLRNDYPEGSGCAVE